MPSDYAEALQLWHGKPYHSLNHYLQNRFGEKIYKIALNGGFTCPNRDGTLGNRGCIFCSAGGSGDFAGDRVQTPSARLSEPPAAVPAISAQLVAGLFFQLNQFIIKSVIVVIAHDLPGFLIISSGRLI